ncbi:unnamed protein product [Closterium sp. NIES-54]
MVTTTTPGGQRVSICTCTRTGRHLGTFTRRLGSSLYTLTTEPSQVAASAQVSTSGQVAASCSCRLLLHQTLLWHHRLDHPSQPRLPGMHSRLLVSGLPRSLPPLPPSPAPPCLRCVEGRQRAAPHSSSFPLTTAPLHTLLMDVDFCHGDGILQSFTLPDSPQQNGIAERRISLVMEVARTSMIHAAAPHFLWSFAVRYVAHQLNLWPRVSLPETSPTLHWTGEVGDASVFRNVTFDESVPIYRLFPYRSTPPPPLPLFLAPGLPPVDPLPPQGPAPSGVSHEDPLRGHAPFQVAVDSGAARGAASGGAEPGGAEFEGAEIGGAEPGGVETGGAEPGGVATRGAEPEGVEPGGAEPGGAASEGAESKGAEPQGAALFGGSAGASPRLSPQQLRAGTAGAGGPGVAAGAGVTGGTATTDPGGGGVGSPGAGGAGVALSGFQHSVPAGQPARGDLAPREWHDTPRTTLVALRFAGATADPSLFLCTDTSLPPFYVLVYVDDLVFATAYTKALTLVKSELQKRHTCTNLGELRSYLGLQITRDRARRTITLTQSHMVHQVLQRFGFQFSSPQPTPLSTSHSLSAPPSDESVEPSGPYPELVGCLMYLMTSTRPDLAYPLSLLARYVALGRHRKVHWDAAKRVLRYLCSTSGMGLMFGGWGPVVLTGHADASWVDDSGTQRSSQGYTFSLGSGSVSWRSTRSSSVLSSICEAKIYAMAMAAQELRWLTYLRTDLGEQPRSLPFLYVDNKAMIALCQEHRLEHRMKHIALRYFLARELQHRGQLCLAYVATRATTADVFTKALRPALDMNSPCGPLLVLGLCGDFVIHPELALLFLTGLCDSRDGLSLFDLTSGASTAPAADAYSTVRSHWLTRDAAARLAMRSHLPPTKRAHFSPVLARYSTVLPCPAAPSGSLSGLYLPSFSTNLVSGADLQDAGVAASSQVFAAASRSGPESAPCSCRLVSHQTLLWHHRLGHPSLPRLRGMASRVLVSGLLRSLSPLPPGPAPTCVPCVDERQRAAPHSSEFPPTEAPLQTLHMDVWGPARIRGQGHERYFLLVVDDYSRYTTVFPLRSKGEVTEVLIDWIRAARLQLRERFGSDFPVLRLHSDRGGEFSSDLLRAFCRAEGIRQTFTLPASP